MFESSVLKKFCIFSFFQIIGLSLFGGALDLSAQSPSDEWRRGGFDAMVAEPGQASSILSNPAGIKTKEERYRIRADRTKPGKKSEWIAEIVSADMFLSAEIWALLDTPSLIPYKLTSTFSLVPGLAKLAQGKTLSTDGESCEACAVVKVLQDLEPESYRKLTTGTGLPADPKELAVADLEKMNTVSRALVGRNLKNNPETVPTAIADVLVGQFLNNVRGWSFEHYSRTLSLSHVNDKNPVAWGFYFGLEQKAAFYSDKESIPLSLNLAEGLDMKTTVPIGFQLYVLAPLRFAFATDFGEAIPGFTFGLGLKFVPYVGVNQTTLGNFISRAISPSGFEVDDTLLTNALISSGGLNLGLDFGVQYHFGAISPKLEFLHTGLKISDLLGINVPFSDLPGLKDIFGDNGDQFRYAIDFDWGIYAEHQFPKYLQIFGGFELIQLRGLIPGGQSPYSALLEPIDHLRFLLGVGLFDNVLRLTAQYYNSYLSPGIMFNLGSLQLQAAFNIDVQALESIGLELALRFRGPHDGFNKRTPYRTYGRRTSKLPKPAREFQDLAIPTKEFKNTAIELSVIKNSAEPIVEAIEGVVVEANEEAALESTETLLVARAERIAETPGNKITANEMAPESKVTPKVTPEVITMGANVWVFVWFILLMIVSSSIIVYKLRRYLLY